MQPKVDPGGKVPSSAEAATHLDEGELPARKAMFILWLVKIKLVGKRLSKLHRLRRERAFLPLFFKY